MAISRRRGRRTRNMERLVERYLTRRSIRSPATAVTTTNIANAVSLSNDDAWRTLDKMHDKSIVDRTPRKGNRRHFLLNSVTRRRYYGRNMQRAFLQCAQELVRQAQISASVLTVLNCTMNDLLSLTDLWTDLDTYNRYVAILHSRALLMMLPMLQWRSEAIRWWLQ